VSIQPKSELGEVHGSGLEFEIQHWHNKTKTRIPSRQTPVLRVERAAELELSRPLVPESAPFIPTALLLPRINISYAACQRRFTEAGRLLRKAQFWYHG
jgi:hypothetical protein